jgi:thymidylate synthase (FAD)
MKTTLVATTTPRIAGVQTADELIAYCARVSNPSNQLNHETADKLLRYCAKHGHWSVFEQASMTVEIVTSRAIAAQILRHRSFSFQEFSQRYARVTAFEDVELRKQGEKNRQGGEQVITEGQAIHSVNQILGLINDVYDDLLELGVAKECARMILPLCTQTTLYMTGTVRSWIHYLQQRLDSHAQKEHRLVANGVRDIFKQEFPSVYRAVFELPGE